MTKDVFNTAQQPTVEPARQFQDPSEIPYELVPLPSQGRLYPEGHPLRGVEAVEIKAMTAMEENILSSTALLKKGTVTRELIRSCLADKNIDQDTLFIGDKNAILFAIRISGFGPEYKVQTRCPGCGHSFLHTFMLDQLLLKRLPDDSGQIHPGENLFEFKLPRKKSVVRFKLLTDAEDDEIRRTSEQRKKALNKMGKNTDIDTFVTDRLIKQIVSVDGQTDRSYIVKFVQNMPAFDSKSLNKHVSRIEPNIEMKQDATCPKCVETTEHNVPITVEFFWPELD